MKKTRKNRRFRSWRMPPLGVAGVLAIVAALAVAGCGGSSSSSSSSEESSTGSSTGSSPEAGGQAPGGFEISDETRECLKEQGVELPEPGQGGELPEGGEPPAGGPPEGGEPPSGAGGAEMQEAFKECGVEMPEGGQGKPSGAPDMNSAGFRKSLTKYVACVRENGYELPEPNLSGEGPVFDESEVDQEDPEFKAASEKCQGLLREAAGSGSSAE